LDSSPESFIIQMAPVPMIDPKGLSLMDDLDGLIFMQAKCGS